MERPALTHGRFLSEWVLANSTAWLLGVVVVLVLASLGESIHFGSAVYVGAGMGWSVGMAQWLTARKWFGATSGWMWSSAAGITLPFLFADLTGVVELGFFLLASLAAIGGLLSGILQQTILRRRTAKAGWWIVISSVAWMSPALLYGIIAVSGHPENAVGLVRNICSVACGGIVLGTISGMGLRSILSTRGHAISC